MDEAQQARDASQENLQDAPSTAEVFQRAADAVTNFITEQSEDNNGLLDTWDKKIQVALAEQTIVDSSEEKNWPDFRLDEWNAQVRDCIDSQMVAGNRTNNQTREELAILLPEQADHVDQVGRIGEEVQVGYEGVRSQLTYGLGDIWRQISGNEYSLLFPEGSSDHAKLKLFTSALEAFINEQIQGEDQQGWGRKMITRIEEMKRTLELAIQEKVLLLAK